jgi:hypothetical protein
MSGDFATLLGDGNGPAVLKSDAQPAIHVARQTEGRISVTREGEVVALQIGNSIVRFTYKDAMRIGTWLTQRAFEAKVVADDKSRIETKR